MSIVVYMKGLWDLRQYLYISAGVGFYFGASHSARLYQRKAPLITIDDKQITFDDEVYYWTNVDTYEENASVKFGFGRGDSLMPVFRITFKSGKNKEIFYRKYADERLLKRTLLTMLQNISTEEQLGNDIDGGEIICPRCEGKGHVDKEDIKRLNRTQSWAAGPCAYCNKKGYVPQSKLSTIHPSAPNIIYTL